MISLILVRSETIISANNSNHEQSRGNGKSKKPELRVKGPRVKRDERKTLYQQPKLQSY